MEDTVKKTRLTTRQLDRLIYGDRLKHDRNSVSSPSAQTTILLRNRDSQAQELEALNLQLRRLKNYSLMCYYIACCQLEHGLRISEVLNIAPSDIMPTGHVTIRGSKGSKNRTVLMVGAKQYLVNCRKNNVYPFEGISRFHVYRAYKSVGIWAYFNGNEKASVTHFFRHLIGQVFNQSGKAKEVTQEYLGHKSINSTSYYHGNQTRKR
jgi:integrase